MKTLIIFGFIYLFTFFSFSQQLSLEIYSLKEIYLVGEPIQILVGIKNVGNTNVESNLFKGIKLKLTNSDGTEMRYVGPSVDTFSPTFDLLNPNEIVYSFFELNRYFGTLFNLSYYDHYLEEGKYTLNISLIPQNQLEISEKIPIQIKYPYGEELNVYNSFRDITEGEVTGKYSASQVAQKLENLHQIYPNSVYSINILTLLDAVYDISLQKFKEAARVREKLVYDYPSVRAYWNLDSVLRNKGSILDKIEFIKKLQLNKSNPLIEKMYDKKIEDLQKN